MCTNLTPIPSKCDSKVLWDKALVKGLVRLFALSIFATTTSQWAIISLMMWYFLSMCFPFLWFVGSFYCANAPLLLQKKSNGNLLYSHYTKVRKEFLEPYSFFCSFISSNLFCFHGRVHNTRLLDTPPCYGFTSQGENTSWCGLFEI